MLKSVVGVVALASLFAAAQPAALAQSGTDAPVEPPPPAAQEASPTAQHPVERVEKAVRIAPGQVEDSLVVRGCRLDLAGVVRGDVLAMDSDVTVAPGAHVGGHLVAIGSTVDNRAGGSVRVETEDEPAAPDAVPWSILVPPSGQESHRGAPDDGSWAGRQFTLLLFGLLGALALSIGAPRAAQQSSSAVGAEPARCLVTGLIVAGTLLVAALVDTALLHTPLRVFWAPVGALIALVELAALCFGWLIGMHVVGDAVARRTGMSSTGTTFWRIALGLGAFFLVTAVLGAVGVGAIGLILEAGAAILGLGASVITGGGMEADWLGVRLRRERRWVSRRSWR